jgi:hypothetical protein
VYINKLDGFSLTCMHRTSYHNKRISDTQDWTIRSPRSEKSRSKGLTTVYENGEVKK